MKLTRDEVREVAYLARLEMSDAELDKFTGQLCQILDYASMLDELDLEGVEPTSHAIPLKNVMRDDVVKPSLPIEEVLACAPESRGDYFVVPRIIDDGSAH